MDFGDARGSVIIGGDSQRALSEQEEKKVLEVVKAFMNALGKFQQYPAMNEIVVGALNDCHKHLSAWLRTHARFEAVVVQGHLQLNKAILSLGSQKQDFLQAFLFYLTERNVRTLEIKPGMEIRELQNFFEFFAKPAKEIVAKKNMARALKRMGVRHLSISSQLVIEDVIIKTKISGDLQKKLSGLNIQELVEKANIISRLDLGALQKVGDLATVVTNLSYTKNENATRQILDRLANTLHDANPAARLHSARTFTQIAEKAVDYTLYGLHGDVGSMMAAQAASETDANVYSTLASGLEKAAQVHIAKGDYGEAMKIIESFAERRETAPAADTGIRRRADGAISSIASPASIRQLISALEEAPPGSETAPVKTLSRMGEKAVADLVDLIYTSGSAQAVERATQVLKEIGAAALPEIYGELAESLDEEYRTAFIRVVGEVGNVKSVLKLTPFLSDPSMNVRAEAFRAVLKIGGPAAENKFVEEMQQHDMKADFFKDRLHDIANAASPGLAAPLLELLNGKGPFAKFANPEVEMLAARALSKIGGGDVVAGLSDALEKKKGLKSLFGGGKEREKIDAAICTALGRIGDKAAEPALARAAKSKHEAVRTAAQRALDALKSGAKLESKLEEAPAPAKTPEPEEPAPAAAPDVAQAPTMMESAFGEPDTGMLDDLAAQATAYAAGGGDALRVRLVLTVGPAVVDNVNVAVPGAYDEGRPTTDQKGVEFDLPPGKYDAVVKDQAFSVTRPFEVTDAGQVIRIDLQDIFNF
ncbi:MAG: HEAT repeat domain-containing protein [Deltaproteobacteria bacterium]|nr:HEAT repeat domain-containing protein [Deltaproteobacteria bacterium]